jgi:hypothetical protein
MSGPLLQVSGAIHSVVRPALLPLLGCFSLGNNG